MPDQRDKIVLTSDLDPTMFGVTDADPKAITISPEAFSIPRYQLSGNIEDYENQSGRQEFVWSGGTQYDPDCIWLVGSDNSYTKWKNADTGSGTFCEEVISCVADDVNLGSGTPDCYFIPEMDGPVWTIANVQWVNGTPVTTDFSASPGTNLTSLVANLNDSDNLPEGWSWDITEGELSLCVPHGTELTKTVFDGGEEVGLDRSPDLPGSASSSLGENITVTQVIPSGGGAAIGSSNTDETAIEAEFASNSSVTVRWVDGDGDERISYKEPVNGWYHPVKKLLDTLESVHSESFTGYTGANSGSLSVDLVTEAGIPSDFKTVTVRVYAEITPDASATNTEYLIVNFDDTPSADIRWWGAGSDIRQWHYDTVEIPNNGSADLDFTRNAYLSHAGSTMSLTLIVVGYTR